MEGREGIGVGERPVVYCVVPRELASKLHEPLRRHFRDDPSVEVIVEHRAGERRRADDRRSLEGAPPGGEERRRIRNPGGRRVGDRRASVADAERPELPRRARPYADRLLFVGALEPSGLEHEDLDTARLVTRVQAGDRDSFATLYMRYFDRVYSYFRVAFKEDSHGAEDATQHVFTQVLEALPRYERRRQPFRAWLYMIVRNHALAQLRKEERVELMDPAELSRRRELLETAAESELRALGWISDRDLVIFVERLPPVQRQVLVLRYMLGLSNAEIAAILGRTPEAVRMLQTRAFKFLRDRLTAVGRAPERHERRRSLARRPQARVVRLRRFSLTNPGPTA